MSRFGRALIEMKFHDDHRLLFSVVAALFVGLTVLVAVGPALHNQASHAPLPGSEPLSPEAIAGKRLYIANGCVACHTQQVRNIAMDQPWGGRPSIAADYAAIGRTDLWRNTATLMGTERTGPDLTSIGTRQPSSAWHLLHLYNPRAVAPASIMPGYPWLFEEKPEPDAADTIVNVPDAFRRGTDPIVAKPEALQLVAYLLSRKQTPLPDGSAPPEFLYQRKAAGGAPAGGPGGGVAFDGGTLYAMNCQACHQANGEGLMGAFPPLKGSSLVLDDDPARMITVIMKGYNSRVSEGYPPMPAIGTINNLRPGEIRAIINHERGAWGNNAREVPLEEVESVLHSLTP